MLRVQPSENHHYHKIISSFSDGSQGYVELNAQMWQQVFSQVKKKRKSWKSVNILMLYACL